MIRNCSLEEISDGKLYSENDMVKADTNQCQGCNSVCCHGMGDSIVLDPYDICRLTRQLQMPFESLVEKHLALNVVDGVILPNLKMAGENETCTFLNEQQRCPDSRCKTGYLPAVSAGKILAGRHTFSVYPAKGRVPQAQSHENQGEKVAGYAGFRSV